MRPRLLDLFSGAGGCARGYQRAGFYVVGVDNRPQPRYAGDEFVQADALEVLRSGYVGGRGGWYVLHDFAAIHASPPCQAHSAMGAMWNARQHADLVPDTRRLLAASGLQYVIENVMGAPLHNPITLCGAGLGLGTAVYSLARHRLFECSFPVMAVPCAHGSRPTLGVYGDHARDRRRQPGIPDRGSQLDTADGLAAAREAMGIDWMNWRELSQAIPPAYTEHIGGYLMAAVRGMEAAA